MKAKYISFIISFIMLLNVFAYTAVFADSTNSINISFSGNYSITVNNSRTGVQDNTVVKGQYGKPSSDSTFRMYTIGGMYNTAANLTRSNQVMSVNTRSVGAAASGEYIHVSFQFLNENLHSNLNVQMDFKDAKGTVLSRKNIITQPFENSGFVRYSRFFLGTKSANGDRVNMDEAAPIGTWNTAHIYFSPESKLATMFINGKKAVANLDNTSWASFNTGIKEITAIHFTHYVDTKDNHIPSAIQLDNIIVEKVTQLPEKQDFTYLGETLDFDDGMSIDASRQSYSISYYDSSTMADAIVTRFGNNLSAKPAVQFKKPSYNKVTAGALGRPSWNKSLHTIIPAGAADSSSAMYYNTGVYGLESGDYAHLTFSVANNTPEGDAALWTSDVKFGDSYVDKLNLFTMSAENRDFQFFGNSLSGTEWQMQKWYKVDMIFKIGDGSSAYTLVDGYINGTKYLSDYELKAAEGNYAALDYIGTLNFTDKAGADYYIDDISFGVFNSSTLHDPTKGYSLDFTDETIVVDTDTMTVYLPPEYSVLYFRSLLNNSDEVTVYNSKGTIVENGSMADVTIKVSNGFGGGDYYKIANQTGYELDIGDFVYTSSAKTVQTQAQIVRSFNTDAVTESELSTGTVIIASYLNNELISVNMTPYTDLSSNTPCSVSLSVDSMDDIVIKAFVVSSIDDIIPLTLSKIYVDKVNESVVIYNLGDEIVANVLSSHNAINVNSSRVYNGILSPAYTTPYYDGDVLMVSNVDAAKLVSSDGTVEHTSMVSLDEYAAQNGKVVTYTKSPTVFVGDTLLDISDSRLKLVNSYLTYDRPESELLESTFSGARPRVIINKERLDKIKSEYGNDKYMTLWGNKIISDANRFLKLAPQSYNKPDGYRLLVPAKTIKERIQKLALAYHLTGETKYVDRAWLEIENACGFPDWNQSVHALDSGIMSIAIACGYDWLYDQWSQKQLDIMVDALNEFQLDPAYESYHGESTSNYGWAIVNNNWNATCNGYITAAACAIFEADTHLYADIIENAVRCMECALAEFYPSGAWKEGPNYWNGTVEPYAEAFATLYNSFGSYFNLEKTADLDKTAYYMIATAGPTGVNNFNDSSFMKYSTTPTVFWLSNVFDDPVLSEVRINEIDSGKATGDVLDMCYFDTDLALGSTNLPLDSYFEGQELVSMRSAYDDNATYVSFHSGTNLNAGSHTHIDSGTFIIDMLGQRFATDPGSHNYNVTGFDQGLYDQPTEDTITRWRYYQHIPEGHNTLLINPDKTIGQNIMAHDEFEAFVSESNGAHAITNLSSAYQGYAEEVKRGIKLDDNRQSVVIRDEIDLNDGNNEVYWFMHTSVNNEIEYVDSNTVIMNLNGKKALLTFITDADTAVIYEADPVQMTLTPSPEQVPLTTVKKLVIKMTAGDSCYLQVKITPYDGSDSVNNENISLADW